MKPQEPIPHNYEMSRLNAIFAFSSILLLVTTLLVVAQLGDLLARASRNLSWLTVERPMHVSVYQLMAAHQVVFERQALVELEEALRA